MTANRGSILLLVVVLSLFPQVIFSAQKKLNVFVSILPQAEFARAIGASKLNVSVMVPKGATPHTYEPTPRQIKELSKADIYIKMGSPIEFEVSWLPKLIKMNPDMALVDMSEGVSLIRDNPGHSHSKKGKDNSGIDPHYWLSPTRMIRAVKNIRKGFVSADPGNRPYYEQNCRAYQSELKNISKEIRSILSGHKGKKFLVYHPSFSYFAEEFDLVQVPIEKGGQAPKARAMIELVELAKRENIRAIIVSPEFSSKSAAVIADQIKAKVKMIDILSGHYAQTLLELARAIASQ